MPDSDVIVDATIVDDLVASSSRALARVAHEVLVPLDVAEQRAAMDAYQRGLHSILDPSDWQRTGKDEFVRKSGWRKIAAWFNLSIELIRDSVDRDEDGGVLRAQTWARAIAPNGRYADGDGYCDVSESRFARNKAKLENDLRGTAATRATNRAISNLVGMGAVSHEEVEAAGGPPFGPSVDADQAARLRRAAGYVLDVADDAPAIDGLIAAICRKAGANNYLPVIAMQAVGLLAAAVKERNEEIAEAVAARVGEGS